MTRPGSERMNDAFKVWMNGGHEDIASYSSFEAGWLAAAAETSDATYWRNKYLEAHADTDKLYKKMLAEIEKRDEVPKEAMEALMSVQIWDGTGNTWRSEDLLAVLRKCGVAARKAVARIAEIMGPSK